MEWIAYTLIGIMAFLVFVVLPLVALWLEINDPPSGKGPTGIF